MLFGGIFTIIGIENQNSKIFTKISKWKEKKVSYSTIISSYTNSMTRSNFFSSDTTQIASDSQSAQLPQQGDTPSGSNTLYPKLHRV